MQKDLHSQCHGDWNVGRIMRMHQWQARGSSANHTLIAFTPSSVPPFLSSVAFLQSSDFFSFVFFLFASLSRAFSSSSHWDRLVEQAEIIILKFLSCSDLHFDFEDNTFLFRKFLYFLAQISNFSKFLITRSRIRGCSFVRKQRQKLKPLSIFQRCRSSRRD